LPLALSTTPANVPDGKKAIDLLDAIPPVAGARGRPRSRPDAYLGDRAYGWEVNILQTEKRGVTAQLARPQDDTHGSGLGRFRYVVERTLAWFGHFRRLRLCYEKCGKHLQAFHDLAAALICLKKWVARHA
jgi:transposase